MARDYTKPARKPKRGPYQCQVCGGLYTYRSMAEHHVAETHAGSMIQATGTLTGVRLARKVHISLQ